MEHFFASDNTKIFYQKWDEVEHPIAVLHIVHGMSEHIMRYDDFAKYLNSKGIIVYGMDCRGHGKTGEFSSSLGHFEKNGWNKILDDINTLMEMQKQIYDLPFFILGHSMGSFMTRNFINEYLPDVKGAIIVGTGNADKKYTYQLTKWIANFGNSKKTAYFIHKTAFQSFTDKVPFDWICTDEQVVEEYKNDPFCGIWMTNGFYSEVMNGFLKLSKIEKNIRLNQDFPMLFLSGKEDPVGMFGVYVQAAAQKYIDYGMKKLNVKLYEHMRHEILNELQKNTVYSDVLEFILSSL